MATKTVSRGATLDIALRILDGFADGYLSEVERRQFPDVYGGNI